MPRKPGRPQWERERVEEALAPLTLGDFMARCDREGLTWPQIVEKLESVTGIRVHRTTLYGWICADAKQQGAVA